MKKTAVFGNYLIGGGCVCIEDDFSLQKIHEIVNHWSVHPITQEPFRFTNETKMIFLDDGLVLFYHPCENCRDDEIAKVVPSIRIDGHSILGTYIIARCEKGEFVNLNKEDITRLEKCQREIEVEIQKELEKRRKNK